MLKIYILIVFIVICGFSNANNIGPAPNSSSLAEMIKGGADLSHTNLSHLNLTGANLMRSDLQNSSLEMTNMSRYSLDDAILNNVRLFRANLSRAIWRMLI